MVSLAFSPDGSLLAIGQGDYRGGGQSYLTLWDTQTWKLQRVLDTGTNFPAYILFQNHGKLLVLFQSGYEIETSMTWWSLSTNTELSIPPQGTASAAALSTGATFL